MDEKIIAKLFNNIEIVNLANKFKVSFIYLFGSVVENEQTPLSDIDVGVYFLDEVGKKEQFEKRIKLIEKLENVLD